MKNEGRNEGGGEREKERECRRRRKLIRGVQVMYAREEPNGIQNHPASGLETNVFHGARQNA